MSDPGTYPNQYWHCMVSFPGEGKRYDYSVSNDMTVEELFRTIVSPWHENKTFLVSGRIISHPYNLKEIRITHTPHPKSFYAEEHDNKMRSSNISDLATDRRTLPILRGDDLTHDLLFEDHRIQHPSSPSSTREVFVVHGHDEHAKEAVSRFLAHLDLKPIILHEQPNGGRTIIEKFESFSNVAFAVILLTPDDIGSVKADASATKPRARQNVVFELGYFIGKLGRDKVCALKKGEIEILTDISGVLYVDMDERGAWKMELAKELKAAGFEIEASKLIA